MDIANTQDQTKTHPAMQYAKPHPAAQTDTPLKQGEKVPDVDNWIDVAVAAVEKDAIAIGHGITETDEKIPICISTSELYKHGLMIGATGYGKTVGMSQMVVQSIMGGGNVFVVAPHSDLIYERILPYLPIEIADNIVIIDPADLELPVALNLLEIPDREKLEREGKYAQLEKMKDTLIGNMFNMFKRIWSTPGAWGALLEKNLTYIFQAIMSIPGTTLIDAHWVLTNWEKRARLINMLEREELRTFFIHEMNEMKYEDTSSVRNRLGKFALSEPLKAALCCRDNPLRMIDLVQPGKIVLIDLDQKKQGIETMRIMGLIYITQIWMAVIAKKGYDVVTEERRADFPTFLFIDEFQNFATGGFQDMLSEARKYNLGVIMATQYLQQIEQAMLEGIIANVATPICFGVGVNDAEIMSKVLETKQEYLTAIDPFQFYVRTIVEHKKTVAGKTTIEHRKTGPMWGATYPPLAWPNDWREKVKEFKKISRQNYGRPYDPANTSLFGGDVQDTMDLLLAVYSLGIETHRESFRGKEIRSRLEDMSHLPDLISDREMRRLLQSASASGKIEVDTSKAVAGPPPRNKEEREDIWKSTFYKISIDGAIYMGIRTDAGADVTAGGDIHKHLLMRVMKFMAERGVKMRITKQGGGDVKPDADIFTTPNLTGRKATDVHRIQDTLRETWIYQQSRGLDINVEVECTTLSHPDKVYKNLSKGMVQDRIVFFVVATTEDAHKLCEMLREFVEEKYKGYVIDPTKAFREGALPRKPTNHDYKIFIVNEGEELKQMDTTTGKIKIVEKVATVDIPAESFDLWKSLIPVLNELLGAAGGDTSTITLQRLHEEVQRAQPNVTINGLLDAMKKADMVPQQLDVKEIKNTICIITKRAVERMQATVRQMSVNVEEERKTEETENALILRASQLLRKRIIEAEGRETFADVGDMARKLNTNKWIIAKMLRKMAVESDPTDNTVTVSDADLLTEEELQPLPSTEIPPKPPETPQIVQQTQEPTPPPTIVKERPKMSDMVGDSTDVPSEKAKESDIKEEPKSKSKDKTKSKEEARLEQLPKQPEEEQVKIKSIPDRLLEHFQTHPKPQPISIIAKTMNLTPDDIWMPLSRLVKKGKIASPQRGIYCNINFKKQLS